MPCDNVNHDSMRVQRREVTFTSQGGVNVSEWIDHDVGKCLARDLCKMPKVVYTYSYQPPLNGSLRTFCEYVFGEFIYDVNGSRRYHYMFREMANPKPAFYTTLLNRDGVTSVKIPKLFNLGNEQHHLAADFVDYLDLHCLRQEEQDIEIPVTVRNRLAFNAWWGPMPTATKRSSMQYSKWVARNGESGV